MRADTRMQCKGNCGKWLSTMHAHAEHTMAHILTRGIELANMRYPADGEAISRDVCGATKTNEPRQTGHK